MWHCKCFDWTRKDNSWITLEYMCSSRLSSSRAGAGRGVDNSKGFSRWEYCLFAAAAAATSAEEEERRDQVFRATANQSDWGPISLPLCFQKYCTRKRNPCEARRMRVRGFVTALARHPRFICFARAHTYAINEKGSSSSSSNCRNCARLFVWMTRSKRKRERGSINNRSLIFTINILLLYSMLSQLKSIRLKNSPSALLY